MAVAYYEQESRDYTFVPALGSYLEVKQYDALGNLVPSAASAGVTFDIKQGIIFETWFNADTTHSGSAGSKLWTRTGYDWLFSLVLDFPANPTTERKWAQSHLGSMRYIAMKFYIGNPAFWAAQTGNTAVRSMQSAKALLKSCETRLDNSGMEVVGLNIAGQGSSLLWTYEGNTPIHPGLWF